MAYYQALGRVLTNAAPAQPTFSPDVLEPGHEGRRGATQADIDAMRGVCIKAAAGDPTAEATCARMYPAARAAGGGSGGGGDTGSSSMLPLLLLAGAAVGVVWFIRRKKSQETTP